METVAEARQPYAVDIVLTINSVFPAKIGQQSASYGLRSAVACCQRHTWFVNLHSLLSQTYTDKLLLAKSQQRWKLTICDPNHLGKHLWTSCSPRCLAFSFDLRQKIREGLIGKRTDNANIVRSRFFATEVDICLFVPKVLLSYVSGLPAFASGFLVTGIKNRSSCPMPTAKLLTWSLTSFLPKTSSLGVQIRQ
jgi:hypothetical protein